MIQVALPPRVVDPTGRPALDFIGPKGAAYVVFDVDHRGNQAYVCASTLKTTDSPLEDTMFWGWVPTTEEAVVLAMDVCRVGADAARTLDCEV